MELYQDVPLIEVAYENNGKKAVLTFLDEKNGVILEVNFNKQDYDNTKNEFVDSQEKAEKVEEWCKEYFDTDFDNLTNAVGTKKDVYSYPDKGFSSLWKSDYPEKFDKDMEGQIFQTEIESVEDDGIGIHIRYKIDENLYQTNMTYAKYVENLKKWFDDPVKKEKQYDKFKDKFGVSVENADEIIGKEVMVEVKKAFGKYLYGDIKKPQWSK